MKINWFSLKNLIPIHIKFKDTEYEIVWVDTFKDETIEGETRFNSSQIVLKMDKDNKEVVHTFFHELLHAASEEYDVGLTEKQVKKLEKSLTDWFQIGYKVNNVTRRKNGSSNKR